MINSKVPITLSQFVIDPLVKAPYDIAAWYCVSTPFIGNKHGKSNRMRDWGTTSTQLMDVVDMFGYPYDRPRTERLVNLYVAFDWMQKEERMPHNLSQWRKIIRSQWQNYLILDDERKTIIMLDGPVETPIRLPDVLQKITLKEIVKLMSMVDAQKANSAIPIYNDFNADDTEIPSFVRNYNYYGDYETSKKLLDIEITISPKTMRPLTRVRAPTNTIVPWNSESERIYGPLSGQVSAYNYFRRYVEEKKDYPTVNEYIIFIADKEANKEFNPKDTLPEYLMVHIDALFRDYKKVLGENFEKICVYDFIELSRNSMPIDKRPTLDGTDKLV